MQDWSQNPELKIPPTPVAPEEIHDYDGLDERTDSGPDTRGPTPISEFGVVVGVYTVDDDDAVDPAFEENVKRTYISY